MNRFDYLKSLQKDKSITFCQSYLETGICVNEDCQAFNPNYKSQCFLIKKPSKFEMNTNKLFRIVFGDQFRILFRNQYNKEDN